MTRAEHLQWAKTRALEYVTAGDLSQAFASFAADLGKHQELDGARKLNAEMGIALLAAGLLSTPSKMREWINGFN